MKRFRFFHIITLIAGASFCLSLTGCSKGSSTKAASGNDNIKIMATFYPLQIMLMNITENVPGVELTMMAPADTGCLHDYQLTTRDMTNLERCNILVMNGAGMEDFVEKALELKDPSSIIVASEGYDIQWDNPHIWVSPQGAIHEVKKITEGLCKLDPQHSDLYTQNSSRYIQKLQQLSDNMHARLDAFAGTRIITFHEAFPYFASEFNLELAAVIEREPGTEPSPRELSQMIDLIKETASSGRKPALFAEPQYSSSSASVIASETGLEVGELDPGVTGQLTPDAYIQAMEKNTQVLEKFLK